jgi:hypothetical protein
VNVSELPTGVLFTDTYSRGELETLSIGDYGKEHNIHAPFLGYHREINGVPSMPWLVTCGNAVLSGREPRCCDV